MEDLSLMSDGDKLRFLAHWFDKKYPDNPDNDVQEDLRRMAFKMDAFDNAYDIMRIESNSPSK